MGYSKKHAPVAIAIAVTHRWFPDVEFVFRFARRMPVAVADRERELLGLDERQREQEARRIIIESVADLLVVEPEGFDDFPGDGRPLSERAREYFFDEDHPELGEIAIAAWRSYREAAMPSSYLKSGPGGS